MQSAGSKFNGRLKSAARAVTYALNKENREAADCDHAVKVKDPQNLFSVLEVDRLKIAFDMHAHGGDENVVYVDYLEDLLKTLFIVPTEAEMHSLALAMDSDGTGKIDFGSFFSTMAAFMKPQYGREMLDEAFREISGGQDEIDINSLQRTMIHLGQSTIRFADCEKMICEVDRQGRGRISREDFFHHLQTCTTNNI